MHSRFVHGKGDSRADQTTSGATKSIPTAGPVSGMVFLAIMPREMWIPQSLLQKDYLTSSLDITTPLSYEQESKVFRSPSWIGEDAPSTRMLEPTM